MGFWQKIKNFFLGTKKEDEKKKQWISSSSENLSETRVLSKEDIEAIERAMEREMELDEAYAKTIEQQKEDDWNSV